MLVYNKEMRTARDFQRGLSGELKRIEGGEIPKLVLVQGGEMRYVVLPVSEYERLDALDRNDG